MGGLGGALDANTNSVDCNKSLSFVCIASLNDKAHVSQMLTTLPKGYEVCILWNRQADVESITPLDESTSNGLFLRQRVWSYVGEFRFDEARNKADEMATNDWCFWVDADDRLQAHQHELFERIIADTGSGYGAIYCGVFSPERNWTNDGGGLNYSANKQVRFYRKSAGAKWFGRIHEQILPSILVNGFAVRYSPIMVYHDGYRSNFAKLHAKASRNARGLILQCAEMIESDAQYQFFEELLMHALNTKYKIHSEEKIQ